MLLVFSLDLSAAMTAADRGSQNYTNGHIIMLSSMDEEGKAHSKASLYEKRMTSELDNYRDDLSYSSRILDDYVKKNVSDREAFTSTVSIFTMVSENLEAMDQIEPPVEYLSQYNSSKQAVFYLKWYTWNLARFYETKKVIYAAVARDYFNSSLAYSAEANRGLNRP
jgi:hypothetical protein